jgi:hypothetical protein
MVVGYYIRGSDTWALMQTDERYRDEAVVDGLSYEDAVALYWRKMTELAAPESRTVGRAAARAEGDDGPSAQLPLKL